MKIEERVTYMVTKIYTDERYIGLIKGEYMPHDFRTEGGVWVGHYEVEIKETKFPCEIDRAFADYDTAKEYLIKEYEKYVSELIKENENGNIKQ